MAGEVKARWGSLYTAIAGIVAGGLIPEISRVAVFQKGRVTRKNLSNLLFTAPFWCGMVLIVDVFYRYQEADQFVAEVEVFWLDHHGIHLLIHLDPIQPWACMSGPAGLRSSTDGRQLLVDSRVPSRVAG